jgi:hypothetical protein
MPSESSKPQIRDVLGRDIVYVKLEPGSLTERGSRLYRSAPFITLNGLFVMLFVGYTFYAEKKKRLATDVRYRRRMNVPRAAKKGLQTAERLLDKEPSEFYNAVFKTLQEYLGDLFHLPSGGITTDIVDSELRQRSLSDDILTELKNIFAECDMVRYAPAEFNRAKMQKTYNDLRQVIDYLERNR